MPRVNAPTASPNPARGLHCGDQPIASAHEGRGFLNWLVLRSAEPGQHTWRLAEPLRYQVRPGWVLEVPEGEPTDLASVPRILRSLAMSDAATAPPAVVHDHLYRTRQMTRPEADAMFYGAMLDWRVPRWWAAIYYVAVRIGGWIPWYFRPGT